MEVNEAVAKARDFVKEVFEGEKISNLGLDEVEYDEKTDTWMVTIGFSRPWDFPSGALAAFSQTVTPKRSYKQVIIKGDKVVSVRNRYVEK